MISAKIPISSVKIHSGCCVFSKFDAIIFGAFNGFIQVFIEPIKKRQ